ncbi:MAG: hypothetical protein L6Q60_06765 [Rhodocyclaceae bacterium]|nr:hypothetical protein [Rhodocyclaceae bacterium]
MNTRLVALALFAAPLSASAATVSCPDLGTVVRAGSCPTEDELRFTFNGYCSDNARLYGKGTEVCTDYTAYRKMKNVVLWESRDGDFQGYVSCDLPEAQMRALKPTGIVANKEMTGERGSNRSINRLMCSYGEGVVFSRRSRDECRTGSAEACRTDPASCKAECGSEK